MKRILVLATGGTIASADAGSGLAPALTGAELVALVPAAADVCELDVRQVMNVDSTNMDPAGWLTLAGAVREAYGAYDGFVILHGTDTLAYTAAGLSYLVQRSPKPIVLTGSQLPMVAPATDAARNVHDAVRVACDDVAHGVLVAFDGAVIAGTRARKVRTRSFHAFESVNLPKLAHVDERGRVIWRDEAPAAVGVGAKVGAGEGVGEGSGESAGEIAGESAGESVPGPLFFDTLNMRVQVHSLAPGVNAAVIDAMRPHADALVVEAFGLGGVPCVGGVADALLSWADAGKIVVLATQCPLEGCDPGVYEVGRAFRDRPGVLVAGDMTREAALAKTMWALAEAQKASRRGGESAEAEVEGGAGAVSQAASSLSGSADASRRPADAPGLSSDAPSEQAPTFDREKLAGLFAAPVALDRLF